MKKVKLEVILAITCLAISVDVGCSKQKRYDETLSKDLLVAAINKNVKNTKSLLERNANPNINDSDGTPLLMAVLLKMQISANDLVSGGTIKGFELNSETAQIVKLLLDAGANPNSINKKGDPVLMAAFIRQDLGIISNLIRAGASVKGISSSGSPLIIEAAFSGNPKIVELLIDAGADINAKRKDGTTTLFIAIYKQEWDLSRVLIQKGANVNTQMDVGTPLLFAVSAGHFDTVKLLVEKGADVNAKDDENNSPLSIAIKRNYQQIIDFLKTAGAKL